MKANEMKLSI